MHNDLRLIIEENMSDLVFSPATLTVIYKLGHILSYPLLENKLIEYILLEIESTFLDI